MSRNILYMTKHINYDEQTFHFYMFKCKNEDIDNCYVGHTVNITQRKSSHKCRCNNTNTKGHNLKVYKTIRENGEWDNWTMLVLHSQLCKDHNEVVRIEQEFIDKNITKMNTIKAFITKEEKKAHNQLYKQDHKEEIKLQNQQYYLKRKELKKTI